MGKSEGEGSRAEANGGEWALDFARPASDTLLLRLTGHWTLQKNLPSATLVKRQVESIPSLQRVTFDTQGLTGWDSTLLIFVTNVIAENRQRQLETDLGGLPEGVKRLLDLATAVPERKGARREAAQPSLLDRIGEDTLASFRSTRAMLAFLGEAFLAFLKLLRGKARFRRSDLFLTLQECGAEALLIVTVVSFLVGLILAFVGAVQLRQFGAQIYVANLVGVAMARDMGAMMTAIVMAGRTGAAFAAQLGTMQVNEEIDALTTLGFPPMEFLVLPRILALTSMMPLLTLYSVLMGILGGAVVGVGMLKLGALEYFIQTRDALNLTDFLLGLVKGTVYGVLVAVAGCLRGTQCRGSSAAVGAATTSAVVTGIVFIIVSCAILTVVYDVLGL
jgi:phospholipid/cholesterol/gamma-HCH transport system permease protein